jgi:nitrous oxidase accessory protein NosD
MEKRRAATLLLTGVCALLGRGTTHAMEPVPCVIPATWTILENSELVCDVTCTQATGPCIQFGAPHIKLRLNGFTITGPAVPPTGCVSTTNFLPEDGIASNGQSFIKILGPGMVQRFRRHGLFLAASSNLTVKHVTSHHNCFSGILTDGMTDSDIEENVSVRNAIASAQFPCGGNCIVNSHNNRIRRNEFSGNGSVAPGPPGPVPNDFGVGLVGNSSGNVIEENGIGGNINGIRITATAVNNLIRRNVIAGNPPVQVDPTPVPAVGVDVRDFSPAGANTFEENLCITYEGATVPPPCPNFPKFAGHRNPSKGSHDEHEDD